MNLIPRRKQNFLGYKLDTMAVTKEELLSPLVFVGVCFSLVSRKYIASRHFPWTLRMHRRVRRIGPLVVHAFSPAPQSIMDKISSCPCAATACLRSSRIPIDEVFVAPPPLISLLKMAGRCKLVAFSFLSSSSFFINDTCHTPATRPGRRTFEPAASQLESLGSYLASLS